MHVESTGATTGVLGYFNASTTHTGDLLKADVNGVEKFSVGLDGTVTSPKVEATTSVTTPLITHSGSTMAIGPSSANHLQLSSGTNANIILRHGTAARWAFDGTTNALLPGNANSNDLGSSVYTLRSGYFGTSVTTPLITSSGTLSLKAGTGTATFAGPTTDRTYTLPDANETIMTLGQAQTVTGAKTFGALTLSGQVNGGNNRIYALNKSVSLVPVGGGLSGIYSGGVVTNEGATSKSSYTLPPAATTSNSAIIITLFVQDADGIRITASAGDTIRLGSMATGAAGYVESTTVGDVVTLLAINATEWVATSFYGTWTDGTNTMTHTGAVTP